MIFEGDYVEVRSGVIFDVRGFLHPPGTVLAYPKYVPSPQGERIREGRRYIRINDLRARLKFLRENYPHYLRQDPYLGMTVPLIPLVEVVKVYKPKEGYLKLCSNAKITALRSKAVEFIRTLRVEASACAGCFGVSGSILLGLEQPLSDIDVNVYGYQNCWRVYRALLKLRCEGIIQPLTEEMLRRIYMRRMAYRYMGFREFCAFESDRLFQGTYRGSEYFVKFILEPQEYRWKYGMVRFRRIGRATVNCVVVEDSYSIFTPGWVKVECDDDEITEIAWYRGRYCGIASKGERLIATGVLEDVETEDKNYRRVVVEEVKVTA